MRLKVYKKVKKENRLGNQQLSPDEGNAQRSSPKESKNKIHKRRNNIMENSQLTKPCRLSEQEQNKIIQLCTKENLTIAEISKESP